METTTHPNPTRLFQTYLEHLQREVADILRCVEEEGPEVAAYRVYNSSTASSSLIMAATHVVVLATQAKVIPPATRNGCNTAL